MGIKHLSYKDIDPVQRQSAGQRLLLQHRDQLRNPNLTPEQRAQLHAEINKVNQWIAGDLPVELPPAAAKAPPPPAPKPPKRKKK